MAFLFHKKKSPVELVNSTLKYLDIFEKGKAEEGEAKKKATSKLANNLHQIRLILQGDGEQEVKKELADKMADTILECDFFTQLIRNLNYVDFEARKDVVQIFSHIIRNYRQESIAYFTRHSLLIDLLVSGYTEADIALTCGVILRELSRYEELCTLILGNSGHLDRFFGYVQLPTFDVASDAFSTLKIFLTKHKKPVAKFLEANFDEFFTKYTLLLLADSYVTKRLGLKLLAELLLTRENFNIMMEFIKNTDFLKIIMSLLRGSTRAIQLEAFHVFKIFVANPRKTDGIVNILYRNRMKLVEFLTNFQKDKTDQQFIEEKNILLKTLMKLTPPAGFQQSPPQSDGMSTPHPHPPPPPPQQQQQQQQHPPQSQSHDYAMHNQNNYNQYAQVGHNPQHPSHAYHPSPPQPPPR